VWALESVPTRVVCEPIFAAPTPTRFPCRTAVIALVVSSPLSVPSVRADGTPTAVSRAFARGWLPPKGFHRGTANTRPCEPPACPTRFQGRHWRSLTRCLPVSCVPVVAAGGIPDVLHVLDARVLTPVLPDARPSPAMTRGDVHSLLFRERATFVSNARSRSQGEEKRVLSGVSRSRSALSFFRKSTNPKHPCPLHGSSSVAGRSHTRVRQVPRAWRPPLESATHTPFGAALRPSREACRADLSSSRSSLVKDEHPRLASPSDFAAGESLRSRRDSRFGALFLVLAGCSPVEPFEERLL
jgi:hypothetical protein